MSSDDPKPARTKRVYNRYFPAGITVTPSDGIISFEGGRFVHSCPICGNGIMSTPPGAKASHVHEKCFNDAKDLGTAGDMSTEEPKVTHCYSAPCEDGTPMSYISFHRGSPSERRAVVMWREDYDAMRNELLELRRDAAEWQRFKELNRNMWLAFKEVHCDKKAK